MEDWIIILAASSTIVIATEVYKYIEKKDFLKTAILTELELSS